MAEIKYYLKRAVQLGTVGTVILLGATDCGAAALPSYAPGRTPTPLPSPTATHTGEPGGISSSGGVPSGSTKDVSIAKGTCWVVPDNGKWIAEGDLSVNGQKPFDSNNNTGTEYKISGSEGAQICADYGNGDAHEVQGPQNAVYQEENTIYQGLRRTGCDNGCSEGVQFVVVQDGNITNEWMETGTNF